MSRQSGRILLAVFSAFVVMIGVVDNVAARAAKSGKLDLNSYGSAISAVAKQIEASAKRNEEKLDKLMGQMEKEPATLIAKEMMSKILQGNSFLPQKSGTRTISMQSDQGFDGFTNYQPSGWKMTETMSGPTTKTDNSATADRDPPYRYPVGLGPVLLNQCTERSYEKSSPCYNSKLFESQRKRCLNLIDAANYIGVGFDGRGFFNSESRRASLVQRVCANRATFMGQDIPDTMNAFGIFETTAETKSFQSVDQYMRYIRHKAGLSSQRNLFRREESKYGGAAGVGYDHGALASIAGAIIGAKTGGPEGAQMGAEAGGTVGSTINANVGSGSGGASAKEVRASETQKEVTSKSSSSESSISNFFAIMYINVILYEITLDEVKPTDLSLSVLKDYMSLPASYYSAGADVKFQNFLLRYGTHYIRSGKFGGQLKVTKTLKTSKRMSSQEFSRVAETEFQSMFATLQSKYTQVSAGFSWLGFGARVKSSSQKARMRAEHKSKSTSDEKVDNSRQFRQSEFTQTTVEAQGGTPEIAEALMDFYTPSFKQLFHTWLESIRQFTKPFEFQLKAIHELFNMHTKELFPAGNRNFGCVGETGKIQVDNETQERFYIDTRRTFDGNETFEETFRVNCKYKSVDDFEKNMNRRRLSLEKSVGVYMIEGPFPTHSFELPEGETGCEEETIASLKSFASNSSSMKFLELKSSPFILAFDLPLPIPSIASTQAKFKTALRGQTWFSVDPRAELIHLYEGCQVKELKDNKICFRNIILTYDESSGFFHVDPKDFLAAQRRNPSLPNWLSGSTIARPKRLRPDSAQLMRSVQSKEIFVPCNVRWLNSYRLDPNRNENCVHFSAATDGDIFVVFAAIPKNHNTWYYLQISSEGVAFYQGMELKKREAQEGMGVLGLRNLYQSYFTCVTQEKGSVIMQFGRADPDSEVGSVYASHVFSARSEFSRLSFYAFGSGEKSVSLMDIRLTEQPPKVTCRGFGLVLKNGRCVFNCHEECDGCRRILDNTACDRCRHVRVKRGSGNITEIECLSECSVAMQPSETGLCQSCPAGTFKSSIGNHKCEACQAGSFSLSGSSKCLPCSAGEFNSRAGQQQCQQCPAGEYANRTGSTSCSKCPVGRFSLAGVAECELCPFGHYGNETGMPECHECPAGTKADKRGMQSCQACSNGTSSVKGSRSCNNKCQKGHFRDEEKSTCDPCPPGSFAESAGSSECFPCKAGLYQSRKGQATCQLAPRGYYGPKKDATVVSPCPPGTYNNLKGQHTILACFKCRPGEYAAKEGSSSCTLCESGYYQNKWGQRRCLAAEPGHHANDLKTDQVQCQPGKFANAKGSSVCTECPVGQFSNKSGSTSCQECPVGYEALKTGSPSCSKRSAGSVGTMDYKDYCNLICNIQSGYADPSAFLECKEMCRNADVSTPEPIKDNRNNLAEVNNEDFFNNYDQYATNMIFKKNMQKNRYS